MRKKRIFCALLALPALLLWIDQPARGDEAPYRIGICLALTGEAARWSSTQGVALTLAAEELGKNGTKIDLFWSDTGTSTQKSVGCFQEMVQSKKAEVVIGNVWAFLTQSMIGLAERNKVPLISTGYFREKCPKDGKYFFSVSEQASDSTPAYSRLLAAHPEMKRVAIVMFDDGEWGEMNTRAVQQAAKETGREVVEIYRTQDMHADFRAALPGVVAKRPDVIFIFHEPVITTKPLRELKYKGAIVHSNALGEQIWDTGKAAELFEGVYFLDNQQSEAFTKRFQAASGKLPLLEPQDGYDALAVAVEALKRNRKDPAAEIRSGEFQGVYQKLKFSESCAGKHSDWHVFRIQNGLPVNENR